MKPDTPQRYAPFTRFLHWGMAACYAFMFAGALAWHLNGSLKVKLGHLALYALMFAVPASGMARQFQAPLGVAHGALAFALLLLIVGHVGMTVAHQRKGEKILQRMM